jgi:small subunit ribosomal protein S4
VPATAFPAWLSLNASAFEGKIVAAPRRDEVDSDVQEQIIIEFYSR